MRRPKILAAIAAFALVATVLTLQTARAQAASTLVIYDDAFRNGFTHNRWNGRNDIAHTTVVKVGNAFDRHHPDPVDGHLHRHPQRPRPARQHRAALLGERR
ncbi:MAG: hypothetical protein R2755_22665 [Acidimicrobiales bacterium]